MTARKQPHDNRRPEMAGWRPHDSQTTVRWRSDDNQMITEWRSDDNQMITEWRSDEAIWWQDHRMAVGWWPDDGQITARWPPDYCCMTVKWQPDDDHLKTSWWPNDNRLTAGWQPDGKKTITKVWILVFKIQQLPTFPFFAEHIDMRMIIHTDPIVFLKLKNVNEVACQLLGATIETGRQNLKYKWYVMMTLGGLGISMHALCP